MFREIKRILLSLMRHTGETSCTMKKLLKMFTCCVAVPTEDGVASKKQLKKKAKRLRKKKKDEKKVVEALPLATPDPPKAEEETCSGIGPAEVLETLPGPTPQLQTAEESRSGSGPVEIVEAVPLATPEPLKAEEEICSGSGLSMELPTAVVEQLEKEGTLLTSKNYFPHILTKTIVRCPLTADICISVGFVS